jgi:nucleotide-binding universal stress UspA family protein
MPTATTVLCGVDFSRHSARALRYAAALAERLHGGLIVAFVNDPLLVAASSLEYDPKTVTAQTDKQLARFVAAAIGKARLRVEQVTADGDPATEILRLARERGCGFVAVGTQGLRGASHLFFGSTTERLLRNATLPVLAIPPRAPKNPARLWPKPAVGCAVDLDAHLAHDVAAAADLANRFGARLVLLHAVKPAVAPPWLARRRGKDADRERTELAKRELASAAGAAKRTPMPEQRVLLGSPAEAVASFARRRLQLVMLRLRRGKGWLGSRPGTITYQMLAVSAVPVLALPAESDETS